MKKILYYFLFMCMSLFLFGLLIFDNAYAYTLQNNPMSADTYFNNKPEYSSNKISKSILKYDPTSEDSFTYRLNYVNMSIMTNKKNNYYVSENKAQFAFRHSLVDVSDDVVSCDQSHRRILFTIKAWAPGNDNLGIQDFFKGAEIYLIPSPLPNNIPENYHKNNSYKCDFIKQNFDNKDSTIIASCPIGPDVDYYANYPTLDIHINSDPYIDISSDTEEYLSTQYYLGVSDVVNIDCLEHLPVSLSVKTSSDSAVITIDTNDGDIIGYDYFVAGIDETNQHTSDKTITYSGLSNGSYTLDLWPVYSDGSSGSLSQITFEITDSPLPIVRFDLKQNDKTLTVDASSSFSSNSSIKTYYFKLDTGEWFSSSSSVFNFSDVSYSTHTVTVYVVDALNRKSSVLVKEIRLYSPEELKDKEERSFWQQVLDFFNDTKDFFEHDFLSFWFFPDEEFMKSWFNDIRFSFDKQMGFLSYPFTWTLDLLERFVTLEDTGHYVITWPSIKVPNFDYNIIEAGSFDLAILLQDKNIKTLHDIYIMVLNAMILLSFFKLCTNILARIFGTDEDTYDYISDSETTSTSIRNGSSVSVVSHSSGSRVKRRHGL